MTNRHLDCPCRPSCPPSEMLPIESGLSVTAVTVTPDLIGIAMTLATSGEYITIRDKQSAHRVGSIACSGMATSTGIIMLVYLRQALANADAIGVMSPDRLRQAVGDGATQRLRPKLLTEATTLFGLAPLLLATGTGSDVLQPMIVPVLGGLLIADEVIDLFLPVLFYQIRLRRLRSEINP